MLLPSPRRHHPPPIHSPHHPCPCSHHLRCHCWHPNRKIVQQPHCCSPQVQGASRHPQRLPLRVGREATKRQRGQLPWLRGPPPHPPHPPHPVPCLYPPIPPPSPPIYVQLSSGPLQCPGRHPAGTPPGRRRERDRVNFGRRGGREFDKLVHVAARTQRARA